MQLYKKTVRVPGLFLKALGLTLVGMLEFILFLPAYPAQTPDLTGKGRPSDRDDTATRFSRYSKAIGRRTNGDFPPMDEGQRCYQKRIIVDR